MSTPVILMPAAGGAQRFGGLKQLADLDGQPMCRHVARRLLALGPPVIAVTGAHAEQVTQVLAGLGLETVHNPDWQAGLGSSIATGVRHILARHAGTSAVMICLADQPLIAVSHYRRLLTRHAEAPDRLLATRQADASGPPVLFPADCLAELAAWQGERGARLLLQREVERVERFSAECPLDVDTPEELARARARLRG
ncbi:MAG: nucleotidyltransferase family protein [Rhodanobacteraceae bacterium]